VFLVFLEVRRVDQDVVNIGCIEDVKKGSKSIVNVVLKRSRGVRETKEYD
jgi:hypothetical protein